MATSEPKGRAKGGIVVAKSMTKEERLARAQKGALARWGAKALKKGSFKEHFGIDVECFVLDDEIRTAAISQTGMGAALGLASRGNALPRFIGGKIMSEYVGAHLLEKIEKPLKFQWDSGGAHPPVEVNGYDVTLLIDICHAIIRADDEGKLQKQQIHVARQARLIIGASAKAGIKGLVYALAGYRPEIDEVISAFKHYVLEEAKKYEKEFPTELYVEWQRLYSITPPQRGKNWKEMHLTIDHIYYPLAKSNGKLLEMLRSAKTSKGDRNTKLFQFLNEVGARALRIQLGRVLEMAESSPNKNAYEAKIAERFGGQMSLDISTNYPIS